MIINLNYLNKNYKKFIIIKDAVDSDEIEINQKEKFEQNTK
jgi:hypothetical protein